MFLNLFDKDEGLQFHFGSSAKMILSLKESHLKSGGKPEDFPEYLRQAGVSMEGPYVKIDDSFALMADLKYKKFDG